MPRDRGEGSPDDVKMVLVLRGELRLTAGKSAVQVAHASVMLVERDRGRRSSLLEEWFRQGQKKIALVAPSLDDLTELDRKARSAGITTVWVEDAGLTEVAPGTRTCLGLGPDRARNLDPVTGKLALL